MRQLENSVNRLGEGVETHIHTYIHIMIFSFVYLLT